MLTRPKKLIGVALMLSLLTPAGPAFGEATRPRVLYVTSIDSATVAMFTVDRETGALTPLADPIPAGTEPHAVVASPDGRFVYVADVGSDRLLVFSVTASGALTALDEAPVDGDPFGLAMAPDGRMLYATSQGTSRLTPFSVGPERPADRAARLACRRA